MNYKENVSYVSIWVIIILVTLSWSAFITVSLLDFFNVINVAKALESLKCLSIFLNK